MSALEVSGLEARYGRARILFDVAFEVSGAAAGLAGAIGVVRRGGIVVQIGNLPGGHIPIPANAVMAKEIDLRGSFRFGSEFMTAVELIGNGSVDVLSLVTLTAHLCDFFAGDGARSAQDRPALARACEGDGVQAEAIANYRAALEIGLRPAEMAGRLRDLRDLRALRVPFLVLASWRSWRPWRFKVLSSPRPRKSGLRA